MEEKISLTGNPEAEVFHCLQLLRRDPCERLDRQNHRVQDSRLIQVAQSLHCEVPVLAALQSGTLSEPLRVQVEAGLRMARMRLAALDLELQWALGLLKANEIPVLLLKGMDLGRRFYSSRILRPMTDVDLMVPCCDYERALNRLQMEGGYRLSVSKGPSSSVKKAELVRQPGLVLEIHGELPRIFSDHRSLDALWERSESIVFEDLQTSVSVLSLRDLWVQLIRHATFQHILESPVWIQDFAQIIGKNPDQAFEGLSLALGDFSDQGGIVGLWLILGMLNETWKVEIPRKILEQVDSLISKRTQLALSPYRNAVKWFSAEARGKSLIQNLWKRYWLSDGLDAIL